MYPNFAAGLGVGQAVDEERAQRLVAAVSARGDRAADTWPERLPAKLGSNVKVNHNCLNLTDSDLQGRGQAQNETWVAVDPNNPASPGRQLQRLPAR